MIRHHLSRNEVRKVDQRAVDDYGMTGLMLMENAGRGCADLLREVGISGPVVVCCGKGNNGGDGFVIARHLEARGFIVRVLLFCNPNELTGDARANYQTLLVAETPIDICPNVGIDEWLDARLADADWIVDALLGTGARGEPRAPMDQVLRRLNLQDAKKLAIDLPSGLDCDTGECASTTFRAGHTCTFVSTKPGFDSVEAKQHLGSVHVIDIGIPKQLLDEVFANK